MSQTDRAPGDHPPRNLGLDLVRATEAAALAAGRFMGRGIAQAADEAATKAMRLALDSLDMQGQIVIGEEVRLHEAHSLATGVVVGTGKGSHMDVVLDPIDGRRLLSQGQPGAISVAAVAPAGAMWTCSPAEYMEKLVVDEEVGDALVPECMDAPAAWTLSLVARLKGKSVEDLVVFVLDRSRHRDLIAEIRAARARVMLRPEGDIAGALLAASGLRKVDVLMGIGGAQEGIIAACGVKAFRGAMLARLAPQSEEEAAAVKNAGLDTHQILTQHDLVSGDETFFAATGITDGSLLDGVHYHGRWAETHSLMLRAENRSRRYIRADHYVESSQNPFET